MPTVNINGTSREALLRNLIAALDAVHTAREAVRQTLPNGRDYPGAVGLDDDMRAHQVRVRYLDQIETELQALAEHVDA